MEIHNATEDIVFAKVTEIFDAIEKEGNTRHFCTCDQCRMDTACYVLNRAEPRYISSNRGVARLEQENIKRQQLEADIVTLIYEGVKQVTHNQRPNHSPKAEESAASTGREPVYNIPAIVGRLFNGVNFAPISDVHVELRMNGELSVMKDGGWQNPYVIVDKVEGTFTFWPRPVPTEKVDTRKVFEFSLRIETPDYEPLKHFFQIPVTSEGETVDSYSMDRIFKLKDLYMFPPGEDGDDF